MASGTATYVIIPVKSGGRPRRVDFAGAIFYKPREPATLPLSRHRVAIFLRDLQLEEPRPAWFDP